MCRIQHWPPGVPQATQSRIGIQLQYHQMSLVLQERKRFSNIRQINLFNQNVSVTQQSVLSCSLMLQKEMELKMNTNCSSTSPSHILLSFSFPFLFLCALLANLFYSIITLPPVFPPLTLPLSQNLSVNSQGGDIELRQKRDSALTSSAGET